MSVRVKICGVNDAAARDAVAEAGADWLGLVFHPPSPRALDLPGAVRLVGGVSGLPALVGLFVKPEIATIAAVLAEIPLAALQVYDAAPRVAAIGRQFGLPVWRPVPVATHADLPAETEGADALLMETPAAAGATRPGGNGIAMDWGLLRGWQAPAPWLLAGGLTPGNVAEAIAASSAPAVDVSSGVESAPGRKSVALIRAFVAQVRSATPPR